MLDREYEELLSGAHVSTSWMDAPLPAERDCPSVTELLTQLERSQLDVLDAHPEPIETFDDARWELLVRLRREGGEEAELRLGAVPSQPLDPRHVEALKATEETLEAAAQSRWSLRLDAVFGAQPLVDFHRQLQVLHALAPEAICLLDLPSYRLYGKAWFDEAARSAVPPPPEALFVIHSVHDDERPMTGAWMHTHGLLRCGITELEMLDIPHDAVGLCAQLLNSVAALFLEHGLLRPGETFAPGTGIELCWQPWHKALKRLSAGSHGGAPDRDAYHGLPAAVLFAPKRGLLRRKLRSPAVYAEVLADNPLLYVSTMETERMTAPARERFDRLAALVDGHADDERGSFCSSSATRWTAPRTRPIASTCGFACTRCWTASAARRPCSTSPTARPACARGSAASTRWR